MINSNGRGVTSKLLISPKTVDDPFVKDGLEAVSLLDNEPYFVVGGIATQGYLPSACRRSTSDIDLCLTRPLGYKSFKEMMAPVFEYLHDKGYLKDWNYTLIFYIWYRSENQLNS